MKVDRDRNREREGLYLKGITNKKKYNSRTTTIIIIIVMLRKMVGALQGKVRTRKRTRVAVADMA